MAQVLLAGFRLAALPGLPQWHILIPLGELLLIVGILARFGERRGCRWIVTIPTAFLLVYNGGETFYRYFYMSRFHPASDLLLLPGLTRMLLPTVPVPDFVLGILAVLTGGGLAIVLANLMVGALSRVVMPLRRLSLSLIVAGIVVMALIPRQSPLVTLVSREFLEGDSTPANVSPSASDPDPYNVPVPSTALPPSSVRDVPVSELPDLHMLVIESYGSTLLETEEYRDFITPLYESLENELTGYTVYSGLFRSPAFGGRSWLADGTLLTGIYISDQKRYDDFASSGDEALLLKDLARYDYFRIYAAPGTRDAPDEWRSAYPFDRYLLRYDFGYEGPFLTLGAMSDQFILNEVADHYLQPGRRDFVYALLVSSHVPFEVIPVYREEWAFPRRGKEYEDGDLRYFDNDWLSGKELAEGYLAGIAYSLRTAVGYATEKITERGIVLILGDHQPRKPVSHSVAGYAVPLHLLIPDSIPAETVRDFTSHGDLAPGFLPRFPVPGEPLWKTESSLPGLDSVPIMITELLSHLSSASGTAERP